MGVIRTFNKLMIACIIGTLHKVISMIAVRTLIVYNGDRVNLSW